MTLAVWQRDFQATIMAPEPNAVSPGLAIYRDAYRRRLLDGLAADFPGLRALLPGGAFDAICAAYLAEHPSHSHSMRWIGEALGAFLLREHPDRPELAAMHAFEWALALAVDAPDETPLCLADLAGIAPADWHRLRFQLARHVSVLNLPADLPAWRKSVLSGGEAPPIHRTPLYWLISRSAEDAHYREMPPDEAAALRDLSASADFGAICEDLARAGGAPDRAAGLLATWLSDGLLMPRA